MLLLLTVLEARDHPKAIMQEIFEVNSHGRWPKPLLAAYPIETFRVLISQKISDPTILSCLIGFFEA